jgi:hypothetical protein
MPAKKPSSTKESGEKAEQMLRESGLQYWLQ